MSVSASFRTPVYSSYHRDWDSLSKAHYLVRQVNVASAIHLYNGLWRDHIERYFTEGAWDFYNEPEQPSLCWAVIYMTEYFMKMRSWISWRWLTERYIFSNKQADHLPDRVKSRLISAQGWANINTQLTTLDQIESMQREALETLDLTAFERGLHLTLLGYVYRQKRKPEMAIECFEEAIRIFSELGETFYDIRAKEYLAGTYDYLKDFDPSYNDKAIALFHHINRLVDGLGKSADTERQSYNLGWAYAESARFEEAMLHFKRGYADAEANLLSYDQSLNEYGMAFVCIWQQQPQEAVNLLLSARSAFWGNAPDSNPVSEQLSPLMTAVCSNLLAIAYNQMGNRKQALIEAERALEHLTGIDNPVQLHNVYSNLIILYREQHKLLPYVRYRVKDSILRRQIQK